MTATSQGARQRFVPAIGLQLWLFLLVAFAGTTLPAMDPSFRTVAIAAFGVPAIAWAVLRPPSSFRPLDAAIGLGVAAHLLVSLFSLDREASLEASAIVLAIAAAFWLARRIGSEPTLRRVSTSAITAALLFWLTVVAATWLVEKAMDVGAFGWPPRLDAHQPWVWGSINTPPVLAMLAVPFAFWLPGGAVRRGALVALGILALVVVPFSVGRAAWAGISVAAVSLEPLLGFPVSRRLGRLGSLRWPVVAALAVAAVGLGVLVLTRFGDLAVTIDSRLRLWSQALGLFGADPWTGSGPSTFGWARLNHVPDLVDRVAANAAHNVIMETLAEGGIILTAAFALLVLTWAWTVYRGRHRLDTGQRVAIAALIGYAAFGLLDDLSFLPSVTVILVILAAWSLPPAPEGGGVTSAGRRLPVIAGAFLLTASLVVAPWVVSLGLMRFELDAALDAAVDGRWSEALPAFERAAVAQPSNALHWMGVGLAHAALGQTRAAVEGYELARAANPGDPRPWGALAALSPDRDERSALLREAARRSNHPQYAYRLGVHLVDQGRRHEAAEWLAIATVLRPSLFAGIGSDFRPAVRAALPNAIATVGGVAGRDPAEALWNAELAAGELPRDAPIQWWIAAHLDEGNEAEALRLLQQALTDEPRALRTQQAASVVARATCDRAAFEAAEERIDRLGRETAWPVTAVREGPIGLYGHPELGDYQPPEALPTDHVPQWPLGLIEVRDCGW